jgi:Flp pilus assembly protein TadD
MNRPHTVGMLACGAILVAAVAVGAGLNTQVFGFEEWQQAVSRLDVDPNEAVYPFFASEEMREWAKEKMGPYSSFSPEVRLEALQQAFFERGEFEFQYEGLRTLTAEEAFTVRNGNCMSFTSLFVALSRSLGLPTFLVAVKRQPGVEKADNLVIVNRHVVAGYQSPTEIQVYDFFVTSSNPYLSRRVIDDLAASAIYHTNIGGLAIRRGNHDEALRNLEIATVLAPAWAPAWVNLGVVQSRLGHEEAAFSAFQRALAAEPGNSSALVNLANIYKAQGREEEARTAMLAAADGTRNPFTLIAMADTEMVRGNADEARQYLRRARWWYGKEPEVYDALARLAVLEGEDAKAEKLRHRATELRMKANARAGDQPN